MKLKNTLFFLAGLSLISAPAQSFSLSYLKRGFKSCTGVCDNVKVCKDKDKLEWCVTHCSDKMYKDNKTKEKKLCDPSTLAEIKADIEKNMDKLSEKEKAYFNAYLNEDSGKAAYVTSPPPPSDAPAPPSANATNLNKN